MKANNWKYGSLHFVRDGNHMYAKVGEVTLVLERWYVNKQPKWKCVLHELSLSSGSRNTRKEAVDDLAQSLRRVAEKWGAASSALQSAVGSVET